MRFVVYQKAGDEDTIVLRMVRSNYRVQDGEGEVPPEHFNLCFGFSKHVRQKAELNRRKERAAYAALSRFVPSPRPDVQLLAIEAKEMAFTMRMAVRLKVKQLRAAGVTHPKAEAIFLYQLLYHLDNPGRTRSVEKARFYDLTTGEVL